MRIETTQEIFAMDVWLDQDETMLNKCIARMKNTVPIIIPF